LRISRDCILARCWVSRTNDGADEERPNDIDAPLRAIQSDTKDYTMDGSGKLQASLGALIAEYNDIFSYSVKGRSMDVPQWNFLDTDIWEANPNRAASRQIFTEEQAALSTLIDELLEEVPAAAINEEEEPEEQATGGQDNTWRNSSTQLERNWIPCAQSKREMRSVRRASYSDTTTRRNPCGQLLP